MIPAGMARVHAASTRAVERRPVTVVASPYRCRAHVDEPVTWRGTGCALCAGMPRGRRRRAIDRIDLEALEVSVHREGATP